MNTLHFKTEILEREVHNTNDRHAATQLFDKLSRAKELQDADEQFPVNDSDPQADNMDERDEPTAATEVIPNSSERAMDSTAYKKVKALKQLIIKNIDKRLPVKDLTMLATLLDPSTKVLLQMTDEEKE